MLLYHGSHARFDHPDYAEMAHRADAFPLGLFCSTSIEAAALHGPYIYEVEIHVIPMLALADKVLSRPRHIYIRDNVDAIMTRDRGTVVMINLDAISRFQYIGVHDRVMLVAR